LWCSSCESGFASSGVYGQDAALLVYHQGGWNIAHHGWLWRGDRRSMAVKLFKLRNVPADEAEEIRQLLRENDLAFYETEAGGWGVSMPAIWLHDQARLEEAQSLIDVYQAARTERVRAAFQQLKREGRQQTVISKIRQNPARFILFLVMALFILYVSLAPFIHFVS